MVEGCNEHDIFNNLGFPSATRNYQQSLFSTFNNDAATANCPVAAMSLGQGGNADNLGRVDGMCDFGNMHSYEADGKQPGTDLRGWFLPQYRQYCVPAPKGLVVTETGYNYKNFGSGISDQAGGIYIPRLLLEHFIEGIRRCYIYELIDRGSDPAQEQQRFGLVRYDGTNRPSFTTLKNIISLIKDTNASYTPGTLNYTLGGDVSNLQSILVQKSDGRFFLILYRRVSVWNPSNRTNVTVNPTNVTISFGESVTSVTSYSPVSGATASSVALSNGVATIPLGGEIKVIAIFKDGAVTPTDPSTTPTRIGVNCGGGAATNQYSDPLDADRGFTGGTAYSHTNPILGSDAEGAGQEQYKTIRYGNTFNYSLPLTNGNYMVYLRFAETANVTTGFRVFNIDLNGQRVESNFDIVALAGANRTALVRRYPLSISNNALNIGFTSVADNALISSIVVNPV
jgi:hypothetical protein